MTLTEHMPTGSVSTEIVPGDAPGGPSTSQTIMVSSLRRLLAEVPSEAAVDAYRFAVLEENLLGKDTSGGREWAFRQLRRFYALDPRTLLFRALRDLWKHDTSGQPLLAMLCALARDPVLRSSAEVVVNAEPGEVIGPSDFEVAIEETFPGAYKATTRQATAQKVASSWKQSGHLKQERPGRKVRTRVSPTPAAAAYALMLGYLEGARGQALVETSWARVLDRPTSHVLELATAASKFGMLELRNAGGVVEITFHQLLRPLDGGQGLLL